MLNKKKILVFLIFITLITNIFAEDVEEHHSAISSLLFQSISLMGIQYRWGGNQPSTGMDCSGFVRYVFQKSLGINLPRTAAEMAKVGKRIDVNSILPGDLLFFNTPRGSNTHIGIYLGNNQFIQSPRRGSAIQITDFDGWWRDHFNGAKRITEETVDEDGVSTLESYQNIHNEALTVQHSQAKAKSSKSHKTKSTKTTKNKTSKTTKSKSKKHV